MITVDEAAEIVNEAEEIALAEGCHLRRLPSAERRRPARHPAARDMLGAVEQTWISIVGLAVEAAGLAMAAIGLRRSKLTYDGAYTESHWGWLGLGLAAGGLLAQLFDLAIRPLIWPA